VTNRERRLETALRDLLTVIAADDLIHESVSYMRQARKALELASSVPAIGKPVDEHPAIGSARKDTTVV
jgi:hypothetical protein